MLQRVVLVCLLLAASHAEDEPNDDTGSWEISLEEFEAVATSGSQLVIDVREPEAVKRDEVDVNNYLNIPLNDVESALDLSEEDFKWMYDVDKPGLDQDFVFICNTGRKSEEAVKLSRSMNFTNARYVVGGTVRWIKERPNLIVEIEDEHPENETDTTVPSKDEL